MLYHVLNGDALKSQLPEKFQPVIVIRECLIEGPTIFSTEEDFWNGRKNYLSRYADENKINYREDVQKEIQLLKKLPDKSELCLWFEFDLFCQINMWFVLNYLKTSSNIENISWSFPTHNDWSGFGGMSKNDLKYSFESRIFLSREDLSLFNMAWTDYQNKDLGNLLNNHLWTIENFHPLKRAVNALVELYSPKGESKPIKVIRRLLKEYDSQNFSAIFRSFNKECGEYGYGDLQVLNLVKTIKSQ